VLHRVGERLLDHAVGAVLDRGHDADAVRQWVVVELHAGRPRLAEQRVEAARRCVVRVGLQERDEVLELGQRLMPRLADAGEAGAAVRRGEPTRPRLDHHHGEVVGDDVVQLPGDPGALAAHRQRGERLPFGLELAVALGERRDQLPP
jgi:hypothetical protein